MNWLCVLNVLACLYIRKKHGIDSAGYFYFVIIIDNLSVIHRVVSGLTWLGTLIKYLTVFWLCTLCVYILGHTCVDVRA